MTQNKKILLAEDDPNFGSVLKDYLIINGFDVTHAVDGEQGINYFNKNEYDLCILDVMMPKRDGFMVAEDIKKAKPKTPVIFLTSRAMDKDQVHGLKLGAEDYIVKPCSGEVLLYKIKKALLSGATNREADSSEHEFKIGRFTLNTKIRSLQASGEKAKKLSPKESELLKLLSINTNDLLRRSFALESIWSKEDPFTSRSMDVYVNKLRKIFKKEPSISIENIHGEGFRLVVDDKNQDLQSSKFRQE